MPKLLHGKSKLRHQSSRYEPYISRMFYVRPNSSKVIGHTANDGVNCNCALAEFFAISSRCSYCEKYMLQISLKHTIWIDQQVKRLITDSVNNLSLFDQEIYYNSSNEIRYEILLDSEKCFNFEQYCILEVESSKCSNAEEENCQDKDHDRDRCLNNENWPFKENGSPNQKI